MINLISKIINSKSHVYFISPHLDDVAFSCGELLNKLSGKTDITVINVFSECGDGINSLSARKYLKYCNFSDIHTLYQARRSEDSEALSSLKIKVKNLGFVDALWRNNVIGNESGLEKFIQTHIPETKKMYPTYRFHVSSGKINHQDKELEEKLFEELKKTLPFNKKEEIYIFCPIGEGSHVDHLLVRNVCRRFGFKNTIYWSDLPYSFNQLRSSKFIAKNELMRMDLSIQNDTKKSLCKKYKTQYASTMSDKRMMFYDEAYYQSTTRSKYSFKTFYKIDSDLQSEWDKLWSESSEKNYFNSRKWFEISAESYSINQVIVSTCYDSKNKLIGLIALQEGKLYGIRVFRNPGNNYSDHASILLNSNDPWVLMGLLDQISKENNSFITEISEKISSTIKSYFPSQKLSRSSSYGILELNQNPHRNLSNKNYKRISQIINDKKNDISFKIFTGYTQKLMNMLLEIENNSYKEKQFMTIMSDTIFKKILKEINKHDDRSLVTGVLFFGKKPICFQLGFRCENIFSGCATAYDEEYRELQPGKTLLFLSLSEYSKMGINKIDFSRGESGFKRDFTPHTSNQYSVFFTNNLLIKLWWMFISEIYEILLSNKSLFEEVRIFKNRIQLILTAKFN